MKKLLALVMFAFVGMNLQAQMPGYQPGIYAPPESTLYDVNVKGIGLLTGVTERGYQNLIKKHGKQNVKVISTQMAGAPGRPSL